MASFVNGNSPIANGMQTKIYIPTVSHLFTSMPAMYDPTLPAAENKECSSSSSRVKKEEEKRTQKRMCVLTIIECIYRVTYFFAWLGFRP